LLIEVLGRPGCRHRHRGRHPGCPGRRVRGVHAPGYLEGSSPPLLPLRWAMEPESRSHGGDRKNRVGWWEAAPGEAARTPKLRKADRRPGSPTAARARHLTYRGPEQQGPGRQPAHAGCSSAPGQQRGQNLLLHWQTHARSGRMATPSACPGASPLT
jgi:hypothetical protein